MKRLVIVATILTAAFVALKRYQQHVNKAPNIEY
ncbi:SE2200 family small protein [Staphylococcus lutrae]|uniref:DUF2648 domain-containing protein n=1 Tax=Staphylococcus lutrae TaxID=155085 RepID=A0AAC9WJE0_9STAP|nr:SE2200 family small protein [Staphylococcus lutrae]ARJ50761.1 hypothetical protein B5P37_05225 [Staphylococcus lutrae]PNZ36118.1 DUF2648 domain-containing protein [Staphylococcus lutrae]